MGKGDKKTAKGKRYRGTFGKTRPKKGMSRKQLREKKKRRAGR